MSQDVTPFDIPFSRVAWESLIKDAIDARLKHGYGSPAGVVVADVGCIYQRLDGGAGTSFYVKESGSGTATGWTAK